MVKDGVDFNLAQGTSKFMICSDTQWYLKQTRHCHTKHSFTTQILSRLVHQIWFFVNPVMQHSAQWLKYQCAYTVYLLLKWPWATDWTSAAPEASLLLTTSSDPLSVWMCLKGICKEFLITPYVWSALNSCVKLHRFVHLKVPLHLKRCFSSYSYRLMFKLLYTEWFTCRVWRLKTVFTFICWKWKVSPLSLKIPF